MADDLTGRALEEVNGSLLCYFLNLGELVQASQPEQRLLLGLLERSQLEHLEAALEDARGKFEVPLPEQEVIRYGLSQLIRQHKHAVGAMQAQAGTNPQIAQANAQFEMALRQSIETILSQGETTLLGMLNSAVNYGTPVLK
ncbi:hypothetical protein HYU16_01305 [Candidatus Woesearchaeota archaeon]|nr:hypothetical protein [Candidatus Woesearchaeota archaeon]